VSAAVVPGVARAGHEDEVARVGSQLAGYFGVFHRLMASRLKDVPAADAARLRLITQELKESCCRSEHTFAHAQQILTHLGSGTRARAPMACTQYCFIRRTM
jgi:TH1 protein